jgi:hypothetical protein
MTIKQAAADDAAKDGAVNVDALQVNETVRPEGKIELDGPDGDRYRIMQAEVYVAGVYAAVDFFGIGRASKAFRAGGTLTGDTVALAALLRAVADKMEGK